MVQRKRLSNRKQKDGAVLISGEKETKKGLFFPKKCIGDTFQVGKGRKGNNFVIQKKI